MSPALAPDQRGHAVERLCLDMVNGAQGLPPQADAGIADRHQLNHRTVMIAERQGAADPGGGIG